MNRFITISFFFLSVLNSFAIISLEPALAVVTPDGELTRSALTHDLEIRAKFREIEERSLAHREALTREQRQTLFELVKNHPVANTSEEALAKYDPSGIIGFCFGRSMAVHLLARSQFGLESPAIRKLFVIGDLRKTAEEFGWRFHVTTVVKGFRSKGQKSWYAIDPILEKPLPLAEWIQTIQATYDKEKKAKFYWVSNDAVLPDLSVYIGLNEKKKETGERILELKFDPDQKAGFKNRKRFGPAVYKLNQDIIPQYFYALESDEPKYPFNLVSIRVNKDEISYNNYFADLLDSIYYFVPNNEVVLARRAPSLLSFQWAGD